MKIKCAKHGEVQAEPNVNGDVYCPRCMCDQVAAQMPDGGTVLCGRGGYPVVAFPYVPLQVTRLFEDTSMGTASDADVKPDWNTPCEVCGQVPTVPLTGLCGPCTWGEADTVDGDW